MIPKSTLFHDNFLLTPIGDRLGLTTEWVINDTKASFIEKKKAMPDDWIFKDLKIEYKFNQNGYRAPEWSEVDWSNSIIAFGCSFTMGVGLPYDWTWTQQLSKRLNVPIINLGVSGSSNMLSLYNSYRLISQGIRPLAVINLLTAFDRMTYFLDDSNNGMALQHLGAWALEPGWENVAGRSKAVHVWYTSHLLHQSNGDIYGQMIAESLHNFWIAKRVPTLSRATDISRNVNFPALSVKVDTGRDANGHPGPETIARWVDELEPDVSNLLKSIR